MWNTLEKYANYLKFHWSCKGNEIEKGERLREERCHF